MLKGNTKAKTPTQYLRDLVEPRKSELKALHALIRKSAPGLKPFMQSGMIGYGAYHYTYASGREGDWFYIGLASQKNYISLYFCVCDEKGYVAERYKRKLPKASIGKSCVRFKKLDDVDLKVIEALIRHAARAATAARQATTRRPARR